MHIRATSMLKACMACGGCGWLIHVPMFRYSPVRVDWPEGPRTRKDKDKDMARQGARLGKVNYDNQVCKLVINPI